MNRPYFYISAKETRETRVVNEFSNNEFIECIYAPATGNPRARGNLCVHTSPQFYPDIFIPY